ncbi:apyrase [Anabrus simplex]|uniref:apyrase n=1 Tax=Anabrus simplex TaxID=316456 RepID=UPI0035A36704
MSLKLLPLVCALLCSAAGRTVHPRGTSSLFELSIIHLNDFHARFEQTSWSSGVCAEGTEETCVGGFPRIYTEVTKLVNERPNAIFLNAGDNFQGTLWYTLHKWNVTATFLNKLPTDALTLGNHEFDNKIAGVVPFLEHLQAPVVVANINDSLEPTIQGKYNKSVVIERGGYRIGIVGYITSSTPDISSPEKLIFLDEIEAVKSEAANLKAQGVNIIIGLSHAGIEVDRDVAAEVPDIDVIVGGHSHTLLYTGTPPGGDVAADVYPVMVRQSSGRLVAIVQAGAYSKWLGNLTAWFDEQGELVAAEGNPILLDKNIQQDAGILQEMVPWKEAMEEMAKQEVGTTKVFLNASRGACRKGECNIGSFLTDAIVNELVKKAENGSWTYAAIALTNSGGIRTSIEETHNGVITYNDLVTCQPFENTIDTLELQGRHLLQVLEKSVSDTRHKKGNTRFTGLGFLQMSGIHVTYDLAQPEGSRVVSLSVLCADCRVPVYEPLQLDKWYRIGTVSFLTKGGDGYYVIAENKRNHEIGRLDLDVYMDYLKKSSPIIQGVEGRIQMKNLRV